MRLFELRENRFGRAVYAATTIREGTEIFRFSGKPMLYSETLKLGDKESFALQVGADFYLFLNEPARYFNHSCEPSCGLRPDLQLIALREISKGEELQYDYSTTMMERHWSHECHCGKRSCRGRITDFDLLPRDKRKFYLERGVVQQYVMDVLKKRNT